MPELTTEAEPSTRNWFPAGAWKQWIPALIWLAIITAESTDLFSSQHTSSWLYSLLSRLFGSINPATFDVGHHVLRKLGHFVGFGVLSYLLFRAWRATLPLRGSGSWSIGWARVAFLMSIMVATLDEWHQTTLLSRTGNFGDVVLDSTAALFAQVMLWWRLRRREQS